MLTAEQRLTAYQYAQKELTKAGIRQWYRTGICGLLRDWLYIGDWASLYLIIFPDDLLLWFPEFFAYNQERYGSMTGYWWTPDAAGFYRRCEVLQEIITKLEKEVENENR